MGDDLTEKQRRFVEAFVGSAEGNATEAARQAGYSGDDNALAVRGSEAVRNRKVADAIESLRAPRTRQAIATREERQEWLTSLMRGELTSTKVSADGDPVEVSPPMTDRVRATELLGKMQGDFIERSEVEVKGAQVTFVYPDNGRVPAPE